MDAHTLAATHAARQIPAPLQESDKPYLNVKHIAQGANLYVYRKRDGTLLRRVDGTLHVTKNKTDVPGRPTRIVPDKRGELFAIAHKNGYFWSRTGKQAATVFDDRGLADNAVKTAGHLQSGNLERTTRGASPLQIVVMSPEE